MCIEAAMPRTEEEDGKDFLKQKAEADRREKQRKARQRWALSDTTMRDARRFSEYDGDGERELYLEDFLAMTPERVRQLHSTEQLEAWFSAADANQDGVLSIDEYFMWSLSKASMTHGHKSLLEHFQHYDKNCKGSLDAKEFEPLARDMGFGAAALDIFEALDADGSGALTYRELIDSLAHLHVAGDGASNSLLSSLAQTWDDSVQLERKSALDTTGWVVRGRDFDTVRTELQGLLATGSHVVDLMRVCMLVDATSSTLNHRVRFTELRDSRA